MMALAQLARSLSLVCAMLASACGRDQGRHAIDCSEVHAGSTNATSAALVGGNADGGFLALDAREQNGIVALVDTTLPALCTGTLIAPTVILTAAHCVDGFLQPFDVRIGPNAAAPQWSGRSIRTVKHPTLDLALVRLGAPAPHALAASLLRLDSELKVGDRVELAGFGLTENDTAATRLFTDEIVSETDASSAVVDGQGQSGACIGDSGGPLLVRDALGRPRIAGVLSEGSSNCRGLDRYVYVQPVSDWLDAAISRACGD